jgi:hypothetical protein
MLPIGITAGQRFASSSEPEGLFEGTVFQSNFEGTPLASPTTGLDDSPYDHALDYTPGNAQLTGSGTSKFGDTAMNLYSAAILVPQDTDEFDFGSGDFCIEFFANRHDAAADQFILGVYDFSTNERCWLVRTESSGEWSFRLTDDGSDANSPGNAMGNLSGFPVDSNWHHLAVCRVGTTLSAFADGVRVGTVTDSTDIAASGTDLSIGGSGSETNTWDGYMDALRIIKGGSPYDPTQSTITVPTAYYPTG